MGTAFWLVPCCNLGYRLIMPLHRPKVIVDGRETVQTMANKQWSGKFFSSFAGIENQVSCLILQPLNNHSILTPLFSRYIMRYEKLVITKNNK